MSVPENSETFKPERFVIVNFYGQETCFAWRNRILVFFHYHDATTLSPKLPLIVIPREIKNIRSFEDQVYIVCKPTGVYKLNQALKICLLSYTGIGMGIFFHEVFSVENQWLYMKDKKTKTSRQLFQLQSPSNGCYNICEITLNSATSDSSLRRGLQQLQGNSDADVCVVVYEREVFAISSYTVLLIHHCEENIVDIVPIYKAKIIAGLVLVAKNTAVLVYMHDEKLVFDKVYLESDVRGLCAGINETSDDTIWIVHTDHEYVYYSIKIISRDTFLRTGCEKQMLLAIINYKNKTLVGLSDNKQLLTIEIRKTGLGVPDFGEFLRLKPEMPRESDKIVDEICEKAQELQLLNQNLLEEQEKLKRINIYAHNQAIEFLPQVRVERIAGQLFLRVQFENILPINCHVIAVLKSGMQTTYCAKLIEEAEVVVDMPVENKSLDSSLEFSIDLVTFMQPSQPWCLIRNYTKSPKVNTEISSDRTRLLKAKLGALQKLMTDGSLDMKKLSSIKQSIRRGL